MISVKYVSSAKSPSGYGSAARQFIAALFVSGINVTTESITQTPESSDYGITGDIDKSLNNRDIAYQVNIIHLTPDLYKDYKEDGKYNIGHLFWETDRLPKEWVKPCNGMNEIWCASEKQVEMIKRSGVKTPCYAFSQPIDTTLAYENIKPFALNHPKDFTFYSCFQWIPRKNPRGLIQAYWKEFEGNDKVTLLIKTYRITYVDKELQIIKNDIETWRKQQPQKHYPKIYLLHKVLNEKEMMRFHMTGDVFVNPSSGEGWGRPIQEAMLMGKPVVSTGNGGITDIMTSSYYNLVTSKESDIEVSSEIPWYQPGGMKWWELNGKSLRENMRYAYEKKDDKGNKAQQYVVDNFSFQKIGQQIKERLSSIVRL